jgi:hypothetical protein
MTDQQIFVVNIRLMYWLRNLLVSWSSHQYNVHTGHPVRAVCEILKNSSKSDVILVKSQLAYPLLFKEDVLLLSSNLKMVVDAEILSSTIKAESQRN